MKRLFITSTFLPRSRPIMMANLPLSMKFASAPAPHSTTFQMMAVGQRNFGISAKKSERPEVPTKQYDHEKDHKIEKQKEKKDERIREQAAEKLKNKEKHEVKQKEEEMKKRVDMKEEDTEKDDFKIKKKMEANMNENQRRTDKNNAEEDMKHNKKNSHDKAEENMNRSQPKMTQSEKDKDNKAKVDKDTNSSQTDARHKYDKEYFTNPQLHDSINKVPPKVENDCHYGDEKQARTDLKKRGFTESFNIEKGKLVRLGAEKKYFQSDQVTLIELHRFEGPSNPSDMSVIYALQAGDLKGIIENAYGVYANKEVDDFISTVKPKTPDNSSISSKKEKSD